MRNRFPAERFRLLPSDSRLQERGIGRRPGDFRLESGIRGVKILEGEKQRTAIYIQKERQGQT